MSFVVETEKETRRDRTGPQTAPRWSPDPGPRPVPETVSATDVPPAPVEAPRAREEKPGGVGRPEDGQRPPHVLLLRSTGDVPTQVLRLLVPEEQEPTEGEEGPLEETEGRSSVSLGPTRGTPLSAPSVPGSETQGPDM